MKGKDRVRQLHFNNRLTIRRDFADDRMQCLARQYGCQAGADGKWAFQLKSRGRVIPVGDVRPIAPHEVSWGIAINGMLKLPSGFRSVRLSQNNPKLGLVYAAAAALGDDFARVLVERTGLRN